MSTSCRTAIRSSCLYAAIAAALFLPACALAQERTGDQPPQSVHTLDTVEVRGHQPVIDVERTLTPGAVNIVDADAFHERSVGNTADALRYVPGVWTESSTGGDAVFISSRGSNLDATDYDGNGVRLFQDGLPVSTADGNNHNRFIDPLSARFIAVARGANALTYGASTLGGAMDFVPTTARNDTPSQLSVAAGAFGQRSGRLSLGGVSGDLDGQITLDDKFRDGYRDHSRQRRHGVHANGGWEVSPDFRLRFFATHIDNREQLAGALTRQQFEDDPRQANPSAITGNFQLNVRTDRLATKGEWTLGDRSRLEFGVSHEDQNLYHPIVDKILVDFDGPGPNPPVEVFSLLKNTDQRTTAGMLRYNRPVGDHDVLAGVNLAYTRETGGNFRNDRGQCNGQTGIIDNRSDSTEFFLVGRWNFAAGWTLVYGAQGVLTGRDVRTTDIASGTVSHPRNDYSSFNPRLGFLRALGSNGQAFASISRLHEAPTTFELQDDVRGGDAALDAMRGSVLEAGLRGATPLATDTASWHWDASVYYAVIRDRERWELFGEVHNLLGKDYVATLSVRDEAAADAALLQPGAPRSVSVGLRLRF